jgi:hypothetical protein
LERFNVVCSMSVNKRLESVWSGGSSSATASASKKSVRAAEQDRPDVAAARTAWADNPSSIPIDWSSSKKPAPQPKMARLCGRAPRGWSAKSRTAGIPQAIEAAGAKLLYLPPHSPDVNPIE